MKTNINQEHHYALSKDGVLTHIKDAYNSVEDFFCPHCKCRMIKKCGQIRQWHFAHDWRIADETQKQCTYETYLHSYAKMRLEQWFKDSDSIILRYKTRFKCKSYDICKSIIDRETCSPLKEEAINLKDYFNNCALEKEIKIDNQSFRPDLIWYNDKKKIEDGIFIEVKVTHGCTETKKNSSVRIIEFEIESEDDVDKIISNEIAENEYTHFYGFKIKMSKNTLEITQHHNLKKFILNGNGKGSIKTVTYQNYLCRDKNSCFELTISGVNYINNKSFFKDCYFVAKSHDLEINTCLFCVHGNKFRYSNNITLCEKGNRKFSYYDYVYDPVCSHFEFDYIDYSKYHNNFKPCNIVDIWVREDSK